MAGKTAVITGASRGIGAAIARAFAGAGARVGLVARTEARLRAVADELRAAGATAAWAVADVADPAAVAAAAAALRAELGPVDLVVNNAGNVVKRATRDLDDAAWRSVLAVNLDGTFYVSRAFLDDVVARGGRIINIASIAGRQGTPELAAYCAAKHGVVGLTRSLAEELRGAKVAVNAICPGSVDTDMLREGRPGAEPDMTPEDIARTALFLAGEAPAALTGACIDVFG
ncbi:MAG: SDR family NAD(P)-dependent oxidoreductase [Kofleriaceae bacterium]|nr:SDR family NAD(P)-dependent oxidoreductase [Kofleriaceae bacterium]